MALGAAAHAQQQVQAPGSTDSSVSTGFYNRIAADRSRKHTLMVQRHAAVQRSCFPRNGGIYCALVLVLGT